MVIAMGFFREKHVIFIINLLKKGFSSSLENKHEEETIQALEIGETPSGSTPNDIQSLEVSLDEWCMEQLHMSALYWALTALYLLTANVDDHELSLGAVLERYQISRDAISQWIWSCHQPDGGFSGNHGHDSHLLHTLSAVQLLVMLDCGYTEETDTEAKQDIDKGQFVPKKTENVPFCKQVEKRNRILDYVRRLGHESGAYRGDQWGEVDTRFSYCALSCLYLLNALDSKTAFLVLNYILRECRNFDGGFGSLPGSETHAGQIFCCVGAWSIARHVLSRDQQKILSGDRLDSRGEYEMMYTEELAWWLAERQLPNGGLNGRPEKLEDVCYSWWVLASLAMLNRLHWIDINAVARFILSCQDEDIGGFSDRAGNISDIYHTLFGLAGLSILGNCVGRSYAFDDSVSEDLFQDLAPISPVFCMPITSILPTSKTNGNSRLFPHILCLQPLIYLFFSFQ